MSSAHLLCTQAVQGHVENWSLKIFLHEANTAEMTDCRQFSQHASTFKENQTPAIADGGTYS